MGSDLVVQRNLASLEQDGFLLLPRALDHDAVDGWKKILYGMHARGEYEISNSVGNVAFEKLLALQPAACQGLIGHPAVAPYLRGVMGRQCQLRSLRAHLNPAEYCQEWHMDFYDYYYHLEKSGGSRALSCVCLNTTFYLTDNTPERGRLSFLPGYVDRPVPKELRAHLGYTDDRNNPFQKWCDSQEQAVLHPMAGDVVVFYSHVPHQGAKYGDDPPGDIRANVVLHYQQNPMFPGISFVSNPQFTLATLGYDGTFPFRT